MYRTISIGIITIALAGYFLFAMKREVELLNFEIKILNNQISQEKSTINLLKAEFCHLTSPSRLSKLSKQYLALTSLTPERMVKDPLKEQVIIQSGNEIEKPEINSQKMIAARLVKWRYKASPQTNKYVRHASLNNSGVR